MKKIEKLQYQVEELMYEKDKIAYQMANAQKVTWERQGRAGGRAGQPIESIALKAFFEVHCRTKTFLR